MNKNKVILISIDAMRPDGFLKCKNPYIEEMMKKAYYTLDGKTVLPSVTLPCHMSLFHSVPPQRHGITTNTYVPMVRPLNGLFEQLHKAGKICAMYYGWGQLRDIATPITVTYAQCINARRTVGSSDTELTDCALARIRKNKPDFVFLYMVEADEKGGHDHGWMTEPYLNLLSIALDNVKRVIEECGDEYTIIVTADHSINNDSEKFYDEMCTRIQNLKPGDLVFFGTPETRWKKESITHVGIYIGNGEIIHASHKVRINSLIPGKSNYYENAHRLLKARRLFDWKGEGLTPISQSKAYNL